MKVIENYYPQLGSTLLSSEHTFSQRVSGVRLPAIRETGKCEKGTIALEVNGGSSRGHS